MSDNTMAQKKEIKRSHNDLQNTRSRNTNPINNQKTGEHVV